MVGCKRRSRKPGGVSFAALPWDVCSPLWHEQDHRLPADHVARQIADAVNCLDLQPLYDSYTGIGTAPHRPDVLLRAVLYEMRLGRRSPAQWARDARESGPMRWLLMGCEPARSRWYDFRDRLGPLLDDFHRQVLQEAQERRLTTARRGAIDGTLVAANASRHKLVSQSTLTQRSQLLEEVITTDQADQPLRQEPAPGPTQDPAPVAADTPEQPCAARPQWMALTPDGRQQQQRRYRRAQERLRQMHERNQKKRSDKRTPPDRIVVSTSDPEAALGRDKDKVYRPLYNVQLIDDLDSPFILTYDVCAQPTDTGTLGPMQERATALLGHKVETLLGDAGYVTGANLAVADLAGVTLIGPWQENDYTAAKAEPNTQIPKQEFLWLAQEQTYECPQGHRLQLIRTCKQKFSGVDTILQYQYRCPPEHCRACPLRARCATNPEAGRTITRGEHDDLIEVHKTRMQTEAAKALYRLRKQTVELVNADLKEHRKLRRFSGRGLARARTEVGLMVLTHNLLELAAARAAAETDPLVAVNPGKMAA